jgi:hypothetical protein
MRLVKLSTCVAALCLGAAVTAAYAEDPTDVGRCLSAEQRVKTALDSHAQSASFDDAKRESRYGREYCTNGFYAQGISHYARALQLLGVAEKI